MTIKDTPNVSPETFFSVVGSPRTPDKSHHEAHQELGLRSTPARCYKCLKKVRMAGLVHHLENESMDKIMTDEELGEHLQRLARATAYAEELVEDDYLWFDASSRYCRGALRTLLDHLGVK